MEFSQDMLIDVTLNAAGYLIAALLGITIYSIFRRREKVPSTASGQVPTSSQAPAQTEISKEHLSRPNSSASEAHYIQFGGTKREQSSVNTSSENKRRDRSEILRIAQQMLTAGATSDKIKQVLPISEAEVTLLQLSRKV